MAVGDEEEAARAVLSERLASSNATSWRAEIGLPAPQLNVDVEGFEVDCFWPDLRLVVELDSRTHHEPRGHGERPHP